MSRLFGFEFYKRWKTYKWFFLGFIWLQILLIATLKLGDLFNWEIPSVLCIILLLVSNAVVWVFPFFEGLDRFNKDISGTQAVLELSLPQRSWKKVLTKFLASCAVVLVFDISSVASFLSLFYILSKPDFIRQVSDAVAGAAAANAAAIWLFSLDLLIWSIASFMAIFFCIALARSISHKNRTAVPIGLGVYIAYVVAVSWLTGLLSRLPFGKIPVHISISLPRAAVHSVTSQYSIPALLLGAVLLGLGFAGTAWLVEKRMEA